MLQLQLATEDVPAEELVTTGFMASFGGDPSAPSAEGTEPLAFGRGEGVPVLRDVSNPHGCHSYPYEFQGEAIVVHRGECTFLEKLSRALEASASGVVVINTEAFGVHPSATAEEVERAGEHINDVALVVVTQAAGETLTYMLDSAERLDGRVWLVIDPEDFVADSLPEAEPTRTKAQESGAGNANTLYINGQALVNTRLLR
jgi:mannosidase alpha-like ER degradation enhancer 1